MGTTYEIKPKAQGKAQNATGRGHTKQNRMASIAQWLNINS